MVVVSVAVALFKALFDRVISTTTDNPINSFVQVIVLVLIIFFAQRKTSDLAAGLAGGIAFDAVTFRSMGYWQLGESSGDSPRYAVGHDGYCWPNQPHDCRQHLVEPSRSATRLAEHGQELGTGNGRLRQR